VRPVLLFKDAVSPNTSSADWSEARGTWVLKVAIEGRATGPPLFSGDIRPGPERPEERPAAERATVREKETHSPGRRQSRFLKFKRANNRKKLVLLLTRSGHVTDFWLRADRGIFHLAVDNATGRFKPSPQPL